MHELELAAAEKVPAKHSRQAADPAALVEPAGQGSQAALPVALAAEPAAHARQLVALADAE